jgi:oligosaccharyltransferase complex subunit delta (ribophorin II)
MRGFRRALALAFLLPSALAKLDISAARAVATDNNGAEKAYPIKDGKWAEPVALSPAATFKLSFTVTDGGSGVEPQQAFIVFRDTQDDESAPVNLQLGVKPTGKTTYYMDTAKIPSRLAQTSGALEASLVLSHNGDGYKTTLGRFSLPASALTEKPAPPTLGNGIYFAPQPEITHTFRPDEKEIPVIKASLGAFAVFAPWMTLIALVGSVWPSVTVKSPPTMMYAWFVCLVALEALILRYWIGLRLYQLLPPFIGLGAITAYVGTVALRAARVERLKAGGAP